MNSINSNQLFQALRKLTALILLISANNSAGYGIYAGHPELMSGNLDRNKVDIYYFHFVPRCDECIIMEAALFKILREDYPEATKAGHLNFKSINLSDPDPESEQLIKKLRVRRQLLLLVRDDTTVNLTRDAFRFVERDHERFRNLMKEAIDLALSQ